MHWTAWQCTKMSLLRSSVVLKKEKIVASMTNVTPTCLRMYVAVHVVTQDLLLVNENILIYKYSLKQHHHDGQGLQWRNIT